MDKKVDKSMSAKILNINKGLIEYDDVKYIRIKSRYYNLMIMKDYLPIIGEIDGDVKLELVNDTIKLNNIKGYFMNKQNKFNLFIKEVQQTSTEEKNNKSETKEKVKLKPRIKDIEDNHTQNVEDRYDDSDVLEKNDEEVNSKEDEESLIEDTLIEQVKDNIDEVSDDLVVEEIIDNISEENINEYTNDINEDFIEENTENSSDIINDEVIEDIVNEEENIENRTDDELETVEDTKIDDISEEENFGEE